MYMISESPSLRYQRQTSTEEWFVVRYLRKHASKSASVFNFIAASVLFKKPVTYLNG